MLSAWFHTKQVDALADSIAAELRRRFPPAGLDLSDRKAVEKALRTLDSVFAQLGDLVRSVRPNVYQKARLGNRIRWALREAGYPPAFVQAVTHELVAYVTLASRRNVR